MNLVLSSPCRVELDRMRDPGRHLSDVAGPRLASAACTVAGPSTLPVRCKPPILSGETFDESSPSLRLDPSAARRPAPPGRGPGDTVTDAGSPTTRRGSRAATGYTDTQNATPLLLESAQRSCRSDWVEFCRGVPPRVRKRRRLNLRTRGQPYNSTSRPASASTRSNGLGTEPSQSLGRSVAIRPRSTPTIGPTMTLPRSVADVIAHHVTWELESIDRMYCNLYVPSFSARVGAGATTVIRSRFTTSSPSTTG
jgi:hypothetical protein